MTVRADETANLHLHVSVCVRIKQMRYDPLISIINLNMLTQRFTPHVCRHDVSVTHSSSFQVDRK